MSWKVLSIILYGHTLPNSILLTTEYLTALMELKGRIREALIKMILDFDIPLETEE